MFTRNDVGVTSGKVALAETSTFVYACDRVGKKEAFFVEQYADDAEVIIKQEKNELPFAASLPKRNLEFSRRSRSLCYPSLPRATS
jgi:hypothetical protein